MVLILDCSSTTRSASVKKFDTAVNVHRSHDQMQSMRAHRILGYHLLQGPCSATECPKIYCKFVLHLLVYRKSIVTQMQYRFAVNFGTLSTG